MKNRNMNLPTIAEKKSFYGRITGLLIEPSLEPTDAADPRNLYAMFEREGETCTWLIPHHEIFEVLSVHLISEVIHRHPHHADGTSKLWIGKTDGRWEVWAA